MNGLIARAHARRTRSHGRSLVLVLLAGFVLAGLVLVAPDAFAATGNDVGQNLGDLLKRYAGEIYAGVIAVVSLVFLLNRRYGELGMFLLAAIVVGWLVFSPDQVAHTARDIGNQVLR